MNGAIKGKGRWVCARGYREDGGQVGGRLEYTGPTGSSVPTGSRLPDQTNPGKSVAGIMLKSARSDWAVANGPRLGGWAGRTEPGVTHLRNADIKNNVKINRKILSTHI